MKSKKRPGISGILLIVLILVGMIVWGIFTGLDRRELSETLDKTTLVAKNKLQDYDNYTANDRVKSLVRLLDKTKELGTNLSKINKYGQQDLDEYITEQRLSGVFVSDKNLNVVLQGQQNLDSENLWNEIIGKGYVKEVLEHPEATYTERITVNREEYDLAVVPRQDAEGLVIAYAEKNSNTLDDMTLESVFSDFLVNMHGVIMVCLDDTVVSTNQETLLGKTMQEMQKYYNSSLEGNESGIIRIKLDHKIWYGHKDKMKEYAIYIFFPASQIFMARTVVCGLYTAVAILVYLLFLLIKSNLEKVTLKQSQKRMRIINALGTAYASIVLFDLEKDKVEMIKTSGDTSMSSGDQILSKKIQQNHINEMLTSEYREGFLEFIDMDTVAQRLKGQQSLTYTSQMEKGTWLLSVIVPQRFDSDGNIRAVLLANRDITKEKEKELEQERELRNALAAAEHANKAKTNFLNSISHDIRTPMNAVIGFTALATTHIDNKDLVMEYLKKISISSRHLLSLINDVLDMSRIESGNVKLEEVKVHLPDVFHDLRVIIQGSIAAKQQEHIFDAFAREQTVTKSGIQGTGLGMAISKNIVNMMGGTITVNSEVGKGSEFIVSIECKITGETVKYKSVPELQGARALVVDDDANTCMSVCKMLRDIEMLADWTTSGKEAVLRAKEACEIKKEFKAYIIDWQMPDMNGIETVRRIRKVIGNDTPIIILTAYDWADIAEEAKEAGVTAFVSKPLFMSELRAALTQKAVGTEKAAAVEKKHYNHAGKRVLLVEDNELNREIAAAIMEEAGLIVDSVEDGTDAVERMGSAEESRYDAILMDIQMPKMDGYMATREIRTLDNNKKANIPIIAMTANAFEEDKKKALEAGMNAHIAKPISIDAIMEVLDQIFDRRK